MLVSKELFHILNVKKALKQLFMFEKIIIIYRIIMIIKGVSLVDIPKLMKDDYDDLEYFRKKLYRAISKIR